MYFSLYLTWQVDTKTGEWKQKEKVTVDKILMSFQSADLADVVSHSAVVSDVQSILDRVVAALGELKGLFVT